MTDFQWDDDDLEKLVNHCQNLEGDITSRDIMSVHRFSKSKRRKATALDIRYLMRLAVKNGKARVTKGFLADENDYAIRLLPQEEPFSDELCRLIPVLSSEGLFDFLLSKDYLIQAFPEIGDWSKTHDAALKRDRVYWGRMRVAINDCQFMGGHIEKIPRCIDKKEFVLRLQWIICQYKALQIFLKHRSLEKLTFKFDHANGETLLYKWHSIEELFMSLLTAHASADFAIPFSARSSKKISTTTQQKYLNDVRKDIKSGNEISKETSVSKGYRRIFGDDLFDFKTELSKMYHFSTGTWFRLKLQEIDDLAAVEALAEWGGAEDRHRKYQIKELES
jgi:hypothetical protein